METTIVWAFRLLRIIGLHSGCLYQGWQYEDFFLHRPCVPTKLHTLAKQDPGI